MLWSDISFQCTSLASGVLICPRASADAALGLASLGVASLRSDLFVMSSFGTASLKGVSFEFIRSGDADNALT